MERLQKFLARCGVASRRSSEKLILDGKVKVNDKKVCELGTKIDPEKDIIKLNDKVVKLEDVKRYIMLNKPKGFISAVKDDRGRKTVVDIIEVKERIYPIGRLDFDTTGLLLLTNDGAVFNRIMHPSRKVVKTYLAKVVGTPTNEELENFRTGLVIDGYKTASASIEIKSRTRRHSELIIKIHEGKKRQVKLMCKEIGHRVIELHRLSIGDINCDDIKIGEWRDLNESELSYLMNV